MLLQRNLVGAFGGRLPPFILYWLSVLHLSACLSAMFTGGLSIEDSLLRYSLRVGSPPALLLFCSLERRPGTENRLEPDFLPFDARVRPGRAVCCYMDSSVLLATEPRQFLCVFIIDFFETTNICVDSEPIPESRR